MHFMRRWHAVPLAALVALAVGAGLMGATRPEQAEAGGPVWELSVDCNPVTGGVQSTCDNMSTGAYSLAVVVTNNSGAATNVAGMEFELFGDNTGTLSAAAGADANLNGNPNFSDTFFNSGFSCSLNPPVADDDPSPTATRSFLQCFDDTGVSVANGQTVTLATVTYTAGAGGATFSFGNGIVGDDSGTSLVNCFETVGLCNGAFVGFGQVAPSDTPTPTSTPTLTATPTNTSVPPTPCVENCPTSTSLAYVTVTPTPGTPTAAAGSETAVPTATQPGGTTPPGGQQPGGGTGPGGGRPITLPDTGAGDGGGIDWTTTALMALAATAAGLMAGGVYYAAVRRIERNKGE